MGGKKTSPWIIAPGTIAPQIITLWTVAPEEFPLRETRQFLPRANVPRIITSPGQLPITIISLIDYF